MEGKPPRARIQVSVIIPCYNSVAYLSETVESVLAQTLRSFEIVFVDDESTDSTAALIESIIAANPAHRMRFVRQAHGGVAAARNYGISLASGRFILPLDADDVIQPPMLAECSHLLENDPHTALVYTDRQDFGDFERTWTAGKFELGRLKYFNQIAYCSMFRKSMWSDIRGYRPNVSGFDDWDFWIAAALRGFRGMHLAKPLFKHRRHRDSFLWRLLDRYENLHAQIVLNNREAYSTSEVQMADRFIATGEVSRMLRSSRLVFLGRYYEGYRCES